MLLHIYTIVTIHKNHSTHCWIRLPGCSPDGWDILDVSRMQSSSGWTLWLTAFLRVATPKWTMIQKLLPVIHRGQGTMNTSTVSLINSLIIIHSHRYTLLYKTCLFRHNITHRLMFAFTDPDHFSMHTEHTTHHCGWHYTTDIPRISHMTSHGIWLLISNARAS